MHGIPAGTVPLVSMPERTPSAIRAAVGQLDAAVVQHFTEKWWLWTAVRRWPDLAAQLRECERRAAVASDLADARAASAEIGEILRAAAEAAA